MILRSNRDRYAQQLRHFAAGLITNDRYERAVVDLRDDRDPAVEGIFWEVWRLYSDLYPHRLRGRHALAREERRAVARAIVFLHSDLEYPWPVNAVDWRPVKLVYASMLTGGISAGLIGLWAGHTAQLVAVLGLAGGFLGWLACIGGHRCRPSDPPLQEEVDRWPFPTQEALARAAACPRYLHGANAA